MENKKISVIIPVYKSEKYIKRCVDSVCNQSYKNLEIILVDDGSPDQSGKICDEYKYKDDRVKVIHKKNEGVSAARNDGLKLALGDYIIFLDSDDFFSLDSLSVLVNQMEVENAEISICGMKKEISSGVFEAFGDTGVYCTFSQKEQLINLLTNKYYSCSVCDKLFRREILEDIYFDCDIRHNEDKMFLYCAMKRSSKAVYTSNPLYFYCSNEMSATTSRFNESKFDVIKVNEQIYVDIQKNYPELEKIVMEEFVKNNISIAIQMIEDDYINLHWSKRIRKNLKRFIKRYLMCNVSKGYKISAILIVCSWRIFDFMVKKYLK